MNKCNLGLWSSPSIKGTRPPPCAGFSLTKTGEDKAVMFGGLTPSGDSSEAYVLQLPTMVSYFSHTHETRSYKSHIFVWPISTV